MTRLTAKVISVHCADMGDLGKKRCASINVDLAGIEGDRHRSLSRECWKGDKQAEGTVRRNERQWSALSAEEISEMEKEMDLSEALSAECLGANICFEGIADLSQLPKGTIFSFPSGAELIVEEYNPPCAEMAQKLSKIYNTTNGVPVKPAAYSKAAKYRRGIVGVVEVAGVINEGDEVTIEIYTPPKWINRIIKP